MEEDSPRWGRHSSSNDDLEDVGETMMMIPNGDCRTTTTGLVARISGREVDGVWRRHGSALVRVVAIAAREDPKHWAKDFFWQDSYFSWNWNGAA